MSRLNDVTIRIKIANRELEVFGPKKWAETQIDKFIEKTKKDLDASHELRMKGESDG